MTQLTFPEEMFKSDVPVCNFLRPLARVSRVHLGVEDVAVDAGGELEVGVARHLRGRLGNISLTKDISGGEDENEEKGKHHFSFFQSFSLEEDIV